VRTYNRSRGLVPSFDLDRRFLKNFSARIFGIELAKFFQQIAHPFIFRLRDDYLDLNNLIAALPGLTN